MEIYRGATASDSIAILDMLKIAIPSEYYDGKLKSIGVRDLSEETLQSQNPCLFITGVTVRTRS